MINLIVLLKNIIQKNPNFALLTGKVNNITVLDIDDIYKFEKLLKELDIENNFEVKTITNNGYHLYFQYEPELITKSNYLNIKLDVRNDGGLITIPPSSYEKEGVLIVIPIGPPLCRQRKMRIPIEPHFCRQSTRNACFSLRS